MEMTSKKVSQEFETDEKYEPNVQTVGVTVCSMSTNPNFAIGE